MMPGVPFPHAPPNCNRLPLFYSALIIEHRYFLKSNDNNFVRIVGSLK